MPGFLLFVFGHAHRGLGPLAPDGTNTPLHAEATMPNRHEPIRNKPPDFGHSEHLSDDLRHFGVNFLVFG